MEDDDTGQLYSYGINSMLNLPTMAEPDYTQTVGALLRAAATYSVRGR